MRVRIRVHIWMISNGPLDWPNKEMWSQTIYHLEKMHRPVVSHLKMALFSFLAKPPSSIVWITVVFFIAKYENLNWNTFPSWLKYISHKTKPFLRKVNQLELMENQFGFATNFLKKKKKTAASKYILLRT